MLTTRNGYSIVHYVKENRIIINLPVADRRTELSGDEMASLLMIVKRLFTKQETENANSNCKACELTIEEAIKIIDSAMTSYGEDAIDYDKVFEARDIAIEALKKVDKMQTIYNKVKSGNPE